MWIASLFLALLVVVVLQGWYFPRYTFRSIRYRRKFEPDAVNEGESAALVEHIENAGLLPMPWVQVEASVSADLVIGRESARDAAPAEASPKAQGMRQFQRSLFTMPPLTTVTRTHRVQCPRRGYYRIESVAVTTGDILGLTSRRGRDLPTDTALTVYPALLPIEDIFSIKNSFTGDIVVRRWILDDPFTFRGVRAYQPTDPMNHIHWSATARAGSLQVRQYDFTADTRILILLNVETDAKQWETTSDEPCVERAISMAASIAQYAVDNGVEVGFATNARCSHDPEAELFLEPRSGAAQLSDLMNAMARMTCRRKLTFRAMLERNAAQYAGYDLLVIAPFTSDELEQQYEHLRGLGCHVEQLFVTQEEDA